MTKWKFAQIIKRNKMALERKPNNIGIEWLKPLLILEAEQDRQDLIIFCGKLGKKLREFNEKLHTS